MAGVAFPSQESYGNMARAVVMVNRGGIEHAFHRRQHPLQTGGDFVLVQYKGSSTKFLGPWNQNGVQVIGECELVDGLVNGTDANDGTRFEVDATYFRGIIPPDDFFWARGSQDKYWAASGGVHHVVGTINDDGRLVANGYSGVALDVAVSCSGVDVLVEGQFAGAAFEYTSASGPGLRILWSCCPPGIF